MTTTALIRPTEIERQIATLDDLGSMRTFDLKLVALGKVVRAHGAALPDLNEVGRLRGILARRGGLLVKAMTRTQGKKGDDGLLPTLAEVGLSHQDAYRWQAIAERLTEADIADMAAQATAAGRELTMKRLYMMEDDEEPADNHRAKGTGENEWYTPAEYIEAARTVLGVIDLDPASTKQANGVIKARRFYTSRDGALTRPWKGRVWLNPPYSQPLIQEFIDKLVAEHAAGRVPAAILLTHNYTDTAWFHAAAGACAALVFTRGRIAFVSPDGEEAAPTQGQAFHYFGADVKAFAATFGPFGVTFLPRR